MQMHATATKAPTTTNPRPLTSEEDVLRHWNSSWRDTAFGRAEHYRRCPQTSHRRCGNTPGGAR